MAYLIFSNDVRRHEVNHITQGAKQGLAGERVLIHTNTPALLPGEGCFRGSVFHHLNCQSHSVLADIPNIRVISQVSYGISQASRKSAVVLNHVIIPEDVQSG